MNLLRYFVCAGHLLFCTLISAQITITPNVGTTGVINAVSGSGIVVSNVTINCNQNSYGTFANGNASGLGLATGLLLSTGNTSEINAAGTNGNDDFDTQMSAGTTTDAQLTGLIGNGVQLYDKCVIEFDVVPQCGTISITFLFGSDEYTNWVSAGFNDGFGFFVSGPNPAGGNYTNTNVATLPNGTIVSIDNVNTTTNSTFFVNNNAGAAANHMDGYTTVLTPTIAVVPCQTYHFKLAIADAGDANVDSAVLIDIIQCSNPLTLTTSSTPDNCGQGIGTATVTTSGGTGPFLYNWAPNGGTGATASNLLAGNYTVTVQDGLSCTTDQTANVTVSNTGGGATITQPANITVCSGQTVNATTFTSNPAGATFSWVNSNTAIGLAANGAGDQPSFTATNTGATPLVATVTVNATPAGNNCPITPVTYTITVNPVPQITAPTSVTQCAGTQLVIPPFVTNPTTGVTVNWTNSNTAIGLAGTGTGNISATTLLNATTSTLNSTVILTPSIGTCTGATAQFTIDVLPNTVINVPVSQTVCVGQTVNETQFSSIPNGATFTWTNSNATIGLAANGTGNQPVFTATNTGVTPIVATITVGATAAGGCTINPVTYTITVNPNPQLTTPTSLTQCAGTQLMVPPFVTNPVTGVLCSWTNSDPSIGLAASGTGNISPFTLLNATQATLNATISIIPSLGGCIGSPTQFTISSLPIPTMTTPASISVCPGEMISPAAFLSNPTGAMFTWTNSNTAIGIGATGGGDIAPFTGMNSGSSPVLSQINVVPTLSGCSGASVNFTLEVKPTPVLNTIADKVICANSQVSLVPCQTIPIGAVVNWVNDAPAIGLGAVGIGDVPSFAALNSGVNPIVAQITLTPALSGCIGTPINYTITVNPIPVVTPSNNGPICEGEVLSLSVNSTATGSYFWTGPNSFSSNLQNPSIQGAQQVNAGDYNVVVSANNCDNSGGTTAVIEAVPLPTINSISAMCENATAFNLLASSPGGIWSGNGIVDPNTGQFSPEDAGAGTHVITYSVAGDCPASATTLITVNPVPEANFIPDIVSGCVPLEVVFTNLSNPASEEVLWQFGDDLASLSTANQVKHTYTSDGCFDVSLHTVTGGCADDTTFSDLICVYPNAEAVFFPVEFEDQITISNSLVHFENHSINANQYIWDFGDGSGISMDFNVEHTFPPVASTQYTVMLIANNEHDCPDTTFQHIYIKDELLFYVPNTFTPDGDDYNESFQPVFTSGFKTATYHLMIFNRWGELIFESYDATVGWDGKYGGEIVQDGVYTWKITFKEKDTDKKYLRVGHVSLLR